MPRYPAQHERFYNKRSTASHTPPVHRTSHHDGWYIAPRSPLVAGGVCVGGRREADLRVGGIEDGVESLEERVAVDEVEALAGVAADVADDEVDVVRRAADRAVQRTRPDLGVCREAVRVL